ncbi:hypothetical protein ACXYWI_02525 [Mesomycoplasma ovipneumoniae]|uniref:hypothetical protein n=1 Tax=Mesomycoplasma ovipneumoniae TaxID=29562 RepID=UPI002964C42C|nr:hypothetical protein [Mesomycoplasma ovipneumoniae]
MLEDLLFSELNSNSFGLFKSNLKLFTLNFKFPVVKKLFGSKVKSDTEDINYMQEIHSFFDLASFI